MLVARLRAHLISASSGITTGKQQAALALAEQLEVLNRQVKHFDRLLAGVMDRHLDAPIMLRFPGVHTVIGATLLAEIGEDRDRYPTASMLLAEAGMIPVPFKSGRTERVRFRYAANRHLRHAVTFWAYTSVRVNAWAEQRYQQARSRGRPHYRHCAPSAPLGPACCGAAGTTASPTTPTATAQPATSNPPNDSSTTGRRHPVDGPLRPAHVPVASNTRRDLEVDRG